MLKCLKFMASLKRFRSKNVLNKSHNKLHGLIPCSIIAVNMILEWLPCLCTPQIQLSVKSLNQIVNFKDKGRFFNASQRRSPIGRWVKNKKADVEYPFEHSKVINYTLVVYQYTQSLQRYRCPFLTQLPERKETAQRFHHEANGDFETVSLMAVIGENRGWINKLLHYTNLNDRIKIFLFATRHLSNTAKHLAKKLTFCPENKALCLG